MCATECNALDEGSAEWAALLAEMESYSHACSVRNMMGLP
jgi:hypothetical protein